MIAPSPWIAGESTEYQKRNADAPHRDHLAPLFQGVITPETRVLDIGGGNGYRSLSHATLAWPWHVVDGHDRPVVPGVSYERADLEQWAVPTGYDLAIFGYVLHWLQPETARRLLVEAAERCRWIAIDEFDPPAPVDVPYAHRVGIMTRKRRYGDWLPSSCTLHAEALYRYMDKVDGEPCRSAVWKTHMDKSDMEIVG